MNRDSIDEMLKLLEETRKAEKEAEEYQRKDIDKSWDKFKGPLERLNNSFETNSWPANYTPLCRYCPVKSCDFNQG